MEWGAVIAAAITAILGFLGTFLSNRKQTAIVAYRIEELEKKVNKHNNIIERMFRAEGSITELQHDVAELKGRVKE